MIIELSDDARTFGEMVRKALEAAGGDELLQRAELDPDERERSVEPVLAGLGAWELQPTVDPDELEAAAALCRSVGWWGAPYPAAERLSRPLDVGADGLSVVAGQFPAARIGGLAAVGGPGLGGRWVAVDVGGRRSLVTAAPLDRAPRASAFVADLETQPLDEDGRADVALGLALPSWTLLGMLDRAVSLTRDHVVGRRQFGQPLADFQGVQFQLTDAEVERAGAEELGKYALWSIESGQTGAVADALAFRLATLDAADIVFRVAHQLHGAYGFCDEAPLSWLSRYSAPLRRLPFGVSGTTVALEAELGRAGLAGLFGAGPGRSDDAPRARPR